MPIPASALIVPGMQSEHVAAAAPAAVPAPHASQLEDPGVGLAEPAAQAVHATEFGALEMKPAVHAWQRVAPSMTIVPSEPVELALDVAKYPARQFAHKEAPAAAALPVAQLAQLSTEPEPTTELAFPGSHSVHSSWPLLTVYEPAAQSVQRAPAVEVLPAAQSVQNRAPSSEELPASQARHVEAPVK